MVEDATIRIRLVVADDDGVGRDTGRGPKKKSDAEKQAAAQEEAGETISSRVRKRLLQGAGFGRRKEVDDLLTPGQRRAGRRRGAIANLVTRRITGAAARTGLPQVAGVAGRAAGGLGLAAKAIPGIAIAALAVGAAAFLAEQVLPLVLEAATTALEPIIGEKIKKLADFEVKKAADAIAEKTARLQTAFQAVGSTVQRAKAKALLGGKLNLFPTLGAISDILTAQKALKKKVSREIDRDVVRLLTRQAMESFGG